MPCERPLVKVLTQLFGELRVLEILELLHDHQGQEQVSGSDDPSVFQMAKSEKRGCLNLLNHKVGE